MTLEDAEKQILSEDRIMINMVGENELIVKKLISDVAARSYFVASVKKPKGPSGFSCDELGEYSTLEEVKNHLMHRVGSSFQKEATRLIPPCKESPPIQAESRASTRQVDDDNHKGWSRRGPLIDLKMRAHLPPRVSAEPPGRSSATGLRHPTLQSSPARGGSTT